MARELALLLAVGGLVVVLAASSVAVYRLPEASPTPGVAGTASADDARDLILNKGCGVCHTIPGVVGATGDFGPSLAGVGQRSRIAGGTIEHRNAEDLQRWLLDPSALKPGTMMPKLGLTADEAAAIAGYLETLR
jgi:cytochrome c